MSFRLSLLDMSPIPPGASAAQALAATVRLAQRADALGYHRFWLAEHHQSPALAGAAPEVCDGRDNDCDGRVDEALTRDCSTVCGPGTATCVDGRYADCSAPQPSAEQRAHGG